MKTDPNWLILERIVQQAFPGSKATAGSGRTWHDGDVLAQGISFEAKCQKTVKFDDWWKQTRSQAALYGYTPCLVIQRPPVKLDHGVSIKDEYLAVIPLSYLAGLIKELETVKKTLKDSNYYKY